MKKILLTLLLLTLCAVLPACGGVEVNNKLLVVYPNAAAYSVGGHEFEHTAMENITDITVQWLKGSVTVAYHDKETIEISEFYDGDYLTQANSLHWLVEGHTLTVQYCESGALSDREWLQFSAKVKDLTVLLPADKTLGSLTVTTTAASVRTECLHADSIDVTTNSGNISVVCENTSGVRCHSVSGGIQFSQLGKTTSLDCYSVSGSIDALFDTVYSVSTTNTSGNVTLSGQQMPVLLASTVSGKILSSVLFAPEYWDATSVSGNITLLLPENTGFSATLKSEKGNVSTDFDAKNLFYVYTHGDESMNLVCSAVKGDIAVKKVG